MLKNLIIVLGVICSLSLQLTVTAKAGDSVSSKMMLEQLVLKHKGNVIYLDFWASWCGPCRKSFPWMNKVQEKYQDQGFTIISINLDSNKVLADKFLQEVPANFVVIYDPQGKVAKHFNIQGMPSSILIGRNGMIKSSHSGFFNKKISQYQQEIEHLLVEKE